MGKFLLELCLPEYPMLEFLPSLQAAAALYLSKLVNKAGGWVSTLILFLAYCIYFETSVWVGGSLAWLNLNLERRTDFVAWAFSVTSE